MLKIAAMHEYGEIFPQNKEIAKELYLRCDAYEVDACTYNYAMLVRDSNPLEAIKYFNKITIKSPLFGVSKLKSAMLLLDKTKPNQLDTAVVIESLRLAVIPGRNDEAALLLSNLFYDGSIVPINFKESFRWLCAHQVLSLNFTNEEILAMKSHLEISIGAEAAQKIKDEVDMLLKL
jgi:hypothetical protein